jgi:ribosomal protein S18 acetylase RimI-like enzyme
MQIERLRPEQKKQAAGIVAAAFYDYPQIRFYFPDEKRRKRWLAWYMERVLNTALSFGEVFAAADMSGVLFILPPAHTRLSDRDYVKNGFLRAPLVIGLRRYRAVSACEAYVADAQEKLMAGRPHYYLWGLVADPATQRSGAGTALLDAFLKRADTEGLPVYLETHKAENVAYYERRGFKLIHQDAVPEYGLDFWCLLHEAG